MSETTAAPPRLREPLPPARIILTCLACERLIKTFDLNEQQLAGEMMKARKEHARKVHGWTGR